MHDTKLIKTNMHAT